MDFSQMSNAKFLTAFQTKVEEERRITAEVLLFFREAERRMLYAEWGYSSLLAFAIKELKYSEPAANRRITAMRLLREMPEVAEKIQTGALSLSTVAQASTFFRQNEKHRSTKMACNEKREVLNAIENQSCRQTERILLERFPDLCPAPDEKRRAVAGGGMRVSTVFNSELMTKLEEIQDLLGKKMELKDLVSRMADETLKNLRKKREGGGLAKVCTAQPTATESRSVRVSTKRHLRRRAGGQCEWTSLQTGKRCTERRHLEVDHLTPVAMGGGNEPENLQLVCRTHNTLRAIDAFGRQKMSQHVPSLADTRLRSP
jgi:hypothetical protein